MITSAFGIIWSFSITINGINLGWYPLQAGLVEWIYEIIEFPLVMIVGATVYEGMSEPVAV